MNWVRRSTRKRGISARQTTPEPVSHDRPFDEKPETWSSYLSVPDQIAVHGHLPSTTQTPKGQTKRGAWVPLGRQCRQRSSASTASPSSASISKTTRKAKTVQQQPSPLSSVSLSSQSSENTVAADDSDSTISARSSSTLPKTVPKSAFATDSEREAADAAMALYMLHHADTKPMSVAKLDTPFVNAHQESLEKLGTVSGHWMAAQTSSVNKQGSVTVDEKGIVKTKHWELWVPESAVRESTKREAEYKEKTAKEEETRSKMSAMLDAFEE